jgi:beta-lactamase regulating signal transducer with metallopeptidase domain
MNPFAIEILVKSSAVMVAAAAVNWLVGRKASASWRHLTWTLTVGGLILMPLLSMALPRWTMPLLVTASAASTTSAAPTRPVGTAPVALTPTTGSETAITASAATASAISPAATDIQPARSAWMTMTWPQAAVILYLAGVLLLLIRVVTSRLALHRLAIRAEAVTDSAWLRLLAECSESMGVDRPVRLICSRDVAMPMTFGTRRPAIVIPPVADEWTDDRRRAVLLHELAHVARFDCSTQLVAAVACAIYWMHPGAWWIARRLRVERELACDDRVLAIGTEARDYAGHLLDLAYTLGGSRGFAMSVSMARQGQIEGRLLAVLDAARNRAIPALRGFAVGGALSMAVMVPLAAASMTPSPAPAPAPQRDRDQARLPGTWEMRASNASQQVYLHLNERRNSSRGFSIDIAQLEGLSRSQLTGSGGPATFSIRRDAGTIAFDGVFRSGVGAGTFTFTPNQSFAAELVRRGVERPNDDELYALAMGNIGSAFLDELDAQHYAKPSLAQLVRAGDHGVDLAYLHGMAQEGYRLGQLEPLITLRDHGVDPPFVKGMAMQGLDHLTADELRRARDHGVDPQFVAGMKSIGQQPFDLESLVTLRDHGVDPGFARGMATAGLANLSVNELRQARDHGVDPKFAGDMQDLASRPLTLNELITLRDHGVDAAFARALADAGLKHLSVDELQRARDHGVDPKFARDIAAMGYAKLSIEDLVQFRDHGVTADYVRRQNARAGTRLSIAELIRFRDRGR